MDVPVVMIGPGTGVAPMRSMVYQRLKWAGELSKRPAGKRLEGDVLVFGCRSGSKDYFFKEEWERLAEEEGLRVVTALSRDQGGGPGKRYVQDRLREEEVAEIVGKALLERSGKVYVCGSSGNMPKSVREALVEVVAGAGVEGMDAEAAERYVDGMEKEGRYKQETW